MTSMYYQQLTAEDARHMRAHFLMAVHHGTMTPLQVLESARKANNRPLRKVRLSALFGPLDKDADEAARKSHVPWSTVRPRLLAALELKPESKPDKTLTIGWLLNSSAGGRRWFALCDALRPRDEPPWPGFPWAPPPAQTTPLNPM